MSSSIDAIVHSIFATSKNFGVSAIQLAAAAVGDAVQIGAFAARPECPLPHEQQYDEQISKFHALTTKVGQTYMAKRGFGYHPCLDGYFVGNKAVRSIYFCTHEKTYSELSVAGLWGEVPLDVLKIAVLNVRASVLAGVPARMEMEGVKPSLPFILKDMTTKAMREVAYERGPVRGAGYFADDCRLYRDDAACYRHERHGCCRTPSEEQAFRSSPPTKRLLPPLRTL